jgi:uncharacterized membrane protein
MDPEKVNAAIEVVARGMELVGVGVVAMAFVHAMVRAVRHFGQKREDAYERLKKYIGKSLMLGLEFLVAADIIRTVTIKPTLEGLLSLGMLIVLRIVLGWSIAVEIEGCWPWQVATRGKSEVRSQKSE